MNKVLNKINNVILFSYIYLARSIRYISRKPVVHVFGDSHSLLFQDPIFKIHYIGPATAYRLNANSSTTQSKNKITHILNSLSVKKQYVLLVFGEIDCRVHIYKIHRERHIDLKTVIQDTANAYMQFVNEQKKRYPHIEFVIFNVLPTGEQGNIYAYEYYANRSTRMLITANFNSILSSLCEKNDIQFIDIFDNLISHNMRIKSLIFDDVHYNRKIVPYIKKKLMGIGVK